MPLWLSLLVTTASTVPLACGAVDAPIEALFTTTTLVARVPPKLSVAPVENPVPVTVTEVPPLTDPEFGDMVATVGAGAALESFSPTKLATDGTPALFTTNNM